MLQRNNQVTNPMSGSNEGDGDEIRLADNVKALLDVLRRRWLTLGLVTLVVFGVAATFIMLMTPHYQSVARIQLDPDRDPLARAQNSNPSNIDSEYVETEVTVLNSLDIARAVVTRLGLGNDPEFAAASDAANTRPISPEERQTAVARAVKRNLSVGRDRLTYVINVGFKAEEPGKAADIANAFAEEYIRTKVGNRVGTAETQASFFERQLAELADQVRAADARVAQYRARTGTVRGGAAGTIVDQQVGPLSTQLATAESQAAEARAQLSAARAQVARGGLDSVAEVRSSPVISDLRRQRAEVLRALGEVSSRYGPRHPESIKVNEQLQALDVQIKAEANRAVASLEATSRAADARVASLRGSMRQLEGQQASNTRASVLADSLEREAATKREAYEKMSQLSLESMQAQRSEIAPATIIDRAVASPAPSSPRRALMLATALLVAFACGCATIIAQELLVPGIRNVADFESHLGLPVLAAVPKVPGKQSPANLVLDRSTSLYAESMRIARASIYGVRTSRVLKTITFTSALPAEGKTTTALAFARALATGGARTLLIDADVRRAALHGLTGAGGTHGLLDVLAGEARAEEAIVSDAVERLDLLLVTRPHYTSENLFDGERMSGLLDALAASYDHIIIDAPPVLGLADGRVLAALADGAVMIVRWGKTPMRALSAAVHQLQGDGATVIGGIFSMVDPSSEAIGGMYYSSKYATYYRAR